MGAVGSMETAISGLEANSQSLAVIADNIVNSNTTGFKSSRAEFQSMLAAEMGAYSADQIGRGATVEGITGLFTQGSITGTGRNTDLAINGDGFFMVSNQGQRTYTRDGSFRFDKDGWLTTLNGDRVQAFLRTSTGEIGGEIGDLRIPFDTVRAQTTKGIEVHMNLDARIRPRDSEAFDLQRPDQTAHFSTALSVYDSIGNARAISIYFNKVDTGRWEWHAMTDGANLDGGEPRTKEVVARGSLAFDQLGRLEDSTQETINTSFADGAIPNQDILFSFGDPVAQGGSGETGTTQYGSKNAVFRNVQDGHGAGILLDAAVDDTGMVRGIYSNGIDRNLGQIVMARFEATEGLSKIGKNQFKDTIRSGGPLIGRPGTNGLGEIKNQSLETSNVDLAKEFVDMIKAQRGYQASAKSINVANQMMDDLMAVVGR